MFTCLRNRDLLLLVAGDGSREQKRHLDACSRCATRYQRLAKNLRAIEQTLRHTPPPLAVRSEAFFPVRRWLPVAAALAATLVLSWNLGGSWRRQPTPAPAPKITVSQEILRFLEDDLSPIFSEATERRNLAIPEPIPSSAYAQAALEGGWPCEWRDPFFSPTCEMQSFPLVFTEQHF